MQAICRFKHQTSTIQLTGWSKQEPSTEGPHKSNDGRSAKIPQSDSDKWYIFRWMSLERLILVCFTLT